MTGAPATLHDRLQQALGAAYALGEELAGAGMSNVFLAREIALDRLVVVKVLPPELAAEVNIERFKREILVSARLQHPHIVPVLNAGEIDGLPYFTMPFVQGESLRSRIDRAGPLPVPDVLRVLREMASALAFAHDQGIVHRDIKPDNVLLTRQQHAVITDFGVAKAVFAAIAWDAHVTGQGMAVGTPAYMAPEQAAADPAADHRADLYAFGAVAYEMLSGRAPFAGRTPQATLAAHVSTTPEPLSRHRDGVPPALEKLVMQCLEKSPDRRPLNATDIERTIAAFGTPDPGVAGLSPRRTRSRRIATTVAAAIVIVVLLAGGSVAAIPRGKRATLWTLLTRPKAELSQRRVVVAPFENRTGDSTLAVLGDMIADWVSQGLAANAGLEVVDTRTAVIASRIVENTPALIRAGDHARGVAEETGAGLVVSGAYYGTGDSLRVQARITDAISGRLLRAIDPVTAPLSAEARGDLVQRVRERVLPAVASVVDTTNAGWAGSTALPPSFDAFEAFSRGLEAFFRRDLVLASERFHRATALDSSYGLPYAMLTYVDMTLGRWAAADSFIARAHRSDVRFSPADRAILDYTSAFVHGDTGAKWRAANEALARFPGSAEVPLLAAAEAYGEGRPRAALAILARTSPTRGLNLVSDRYWGIKEIALHVLEDFRAALDTVRAGRRQFPESGVLLVSELEQLGALGRLDDIEHLTQADPTYREADDVSRLAWRNEAIRELFAHGHVDAGRRLAAETSLWARQHLADTASVAVLYQLAYLRLLEGRFEEVGRIVAPLLARPTDKEPALLLTALAAARTGDTTGARTIAATILRDTIATRGNPAERARSQLRLAQIEAALGHREQAMTYLREIVARGYLPVIDFHYQPGIDSLQANAGFRRLVARDR